MHRATSPALVPRIRQAGPKVLTFEAWQARYAYLIWCIHRAVRLRTGTAHGNLAWDWDRVMHDLERYAYRTSTNRHESFVLLK